MKVISISGADGSGKDTAAQSLYELGFKKISFSAPIKDCVSAVFGWDRDIVEGTTAEARNKREEVDQWWSETLDREVSIRSMMREFAEDVMKESYGGKIFAWSMAARILNAPEDSKFVCTDTRFFPELLTMKDSGAIMVGVHRKLPPWLGEFYSFCDGFIEEETGVGLMNLDYTHSWARDTATRAGTKFFSSRAFGRHQARYRPYEHVSIWTHWLYNKYDVIVDNNGSLEDLATKMKALV